MNDRAMIQLTDAERAFYDGVVVGFMTDPAWLRPLRSSALEQFAGRRLPTRHNEEFHYTDLRQRLKPYLPLSHEEPEHAGKRPAELARDLQGTVISVSNGIVLPPIGGVPEGVGVRRLFDVIHSDPHAVILNFAQNLSDAMSLLNLGLVRDGVILDISSPHNPTIIVEHETSKADKRSLHVLHRVRLDKGAQATLVELHRSEAANDHLLNLVMHLELGAGSVLNHIKIIGDKGASHLGRIVASLSKGARLNVNLLASSTRLCRQDVRAGFEEGGGCVRLQGHLLSRGDEHLDFYSVVDHAAPGCTSETQARAVALEHGRVAVQSRVRVGPGAHSSNSRQLIRGLILSSKAEIDAKPELEILNDDVKCSHGTALGDLDPEAIFYLRSRGVPEREARALLVEAFVAESLDGVAHGGARALLKSEARAWLRGAFGGADG